MAWIKSKPARIVEKSLECIAMYFPELSVNTEGNVSGTVISEDGNYVTCNALRQGTGKVTVSVGNFKTKGYKQLKIHYIAYDRLSLITPYLYINDDKYELPITGSSSDYYFTAPIDLEISNVYIEYEFTSGQISSNDQIILSLIDITFIPYESELELECNPINFPEIRAYTDGVVSNVVISENKNSITATHVAQSSSSDRGKVIVSLGKFKTRNYKYIQIDYTAVGNTSSQDQAYFYIYFNNILVHTFYYGTSALPRGYNKKFTLPVYDIEDEEVVIRTELYCSNGTVDADYLLTINKITFYPYPVDMLVTCDGSYYFTNRDSRTYYEGDKTGSSPSSTAAFNTRIRNYIRAVVDLYDFDTRGYKYITVHYQDLARNNSDQYINYTILHLNGTEYTPLPIPSDNLFGFNNITLPVLRDVSNLYYETYTDAVGKTANKYIAVTDIYFRTHLENKVLDCNSENFFYLTKSVQGSYEDQDTGEENVITIKVTGTGKATINLNAFDTGGYRTLKIKCGGTYLFSDNAILYVNDVPYNVQMDALETYTIPVTTYMCEARLELDFDERYLNRTLVLRIDTVGFELE